MSRVYEILYTEAAADDIRGLRAYDRRQILDGTERHLTHQPTAVSKSRIKQMRQPFWSQYRLRLGDFRVYYDVDEASSRVNVLRVLAKANEPTPEEAP